jgi:VWFA-related protein
MKPRLLKSRRTSFLTVVCVFCALVVLSESSVADQQKSKKPREAQTTFHVMVDLVSVNASVTDRSGKPITDLKEGDFQVLEDGVPQKISVFKIQAVPGVAVPLPTTEANASESQPVTPLERKVILFVDDYHMRFEDLYRVKKAGENFIRTGLGPNDLVALITATGRDSTEFTKYRDYVISSLNNLPYYSPHSLPTKCPPLSDYQVSQINQLREHAGDAYDMAILDTLDCASLRGVPNAVQVAQDLVFAHAQSRGAQITDESRRTLFAIQNLTRRLRAIQGPKLIVFLSDGMLTLDLMDQIQKAVDNSIQSDTVIDTINAGGLDATPLFGDATQPYKPNPEVIGAKMRVESESRMAVEDAMNALASDTGGTYFHNNNDLLGLMKSAANRSQISYVLGFYSTNPERNGKFRKLAVKVNRPGVVVTSRKGYFAPKGEETFEAEKNADVKEALQNAQDFKDIPITVGYNITHPDASHAIVAVQTYIEVRKIHFQKRENRNRNIFTIVTVVYDSNDHYIEGRETRIDFNLTDPNYKNVMNEGLVAQASFRLAPGNYRVKAVVREAGETKLGSATKTLEISN